MKKNILISLFVATINICCFNIAISQNLQMITPGKVWHIESGMPCAESHDGCFCYLGTQTIRVGNIRTYEGKDYYEIIWSREGYEDKIIACVREEGRKVFFYACEHEYLMYDFDVNIGDEILLADTYAFRNIIDNHNDCPDADSVVYTFTVLNVDTIEYNNIPRKRITLLPPIGTIPNTWVEGIGCMRALYFNATCTLGGAVCMVKDCYESNELVFENENPEFTWCVTGIENDTEIDKLDAHIDSYNNLHIVNAKDSYISIYNLQGQLLQTTVPDSNDFDININSLPTGLYVIKSSIMNESIKVYNP